MSAVLRVFVLEPPDPDREHAWALYDLAGVVVRQGIDRPARWPGASALEAVVAAQNGRLVTITLPPVPPPRVPDAARFAIEDRLATAPEDNHMAVGAQGADGRVRIAVLEEAWMRAFDAGSRSLGVKWSRAVLESDLAPAPVGTWRWCAAATDAEGFVRLEDGPSVAVGPALGEDAPPEIAAALQSSRDRLPRVVHVETGEHAPERLQAWSAACGVPFEPGAAWQWQRASSAACAGAIDLLASRRVDAASAGRSDVAQVFRPALRIAAVAAVLFALAIVGEWSVLKWQAYVAERDMRTLAATAAPENAGMPPLVAITRRHSALRHRSGAAALDDFTPLVARAAPALATLPPGSLRSMHYADAHLTLELLRVDAAQATQIQRELSRNGLVAIAAPSAAGTRMRIGLD